MNREFYYAERRLKRYLKRYLKRTGIFGIFGIFKIFFETTIVQTLLIGAKIYNKKDTPCMIYDKKTNSWQESIHKKDEISKEEFEKQKALAIADYWINFADLICNFWNKDKISLKQTLIIKVIEILNKIKINNDNTFN